MVILEIICAVLLADFLSGLFHWLEDAYGRENWPITGRLVTKPNILHHHDARYFTRHGWFRSSWLLLCLGLMVLANAWVLGVLTWQVWLVVILGINANQIHKWAHRTPTENGRLISLLQRGRLVQTPRHHAHHHSDPKSSHYCVLTNFLNPILDRIRVWDSLEWVIRRLFGVQRRVDTSVSIDHQEHPTAQPKSMAIGSFCDLRARWRIKRSNRTSSARNLLLVMLLACLTGCVTGSTITRAKGYAYKNEKGETVEVKPAPALYALTPLTVPADIVIYPFWCLLGWGRIVVGLPPD